MIGLMHQFPGFAHLMETEQLNLIVDRIVNAIDTLTDRLESLEQTSNLAMKAVTTAIEYIHLECEGT